MLFAVDTSLFTVVDDPNTTANDMNHELDLINLWADIWRMTFIPDPQKKAVEAKFSIIIIIIIIRAIIIQGNLVNTMSIVINKGPV